MLKNGREADAFAISRIPIPSPPSTKKEVDLLCAARRPDPLAQALRPVQVRHRPHHAEDVAVAGDEPVDGVDAREQKVIKTVTFLPLP